jgi:hypothetical protein
MAVNDPTPENENPVSPKVTAATFAPIVVLAVIAGVSVLISWIATGDGQSWLHALPDWLQLVLTAVIAAASVFIAGYKAVDPLRQEALARRKLDRIG